MDFSGVTVALYKTAVLDTTLVRINQQYPQIGVQITQETEFDHRNYKPLKVTTTDSIGKFSFPSLTPGDYNLVIWKNEWGIRYICSVKAIENENNNISTQDTINSDNDIDYGDDEIEKKEKEEIPLVYSEVWMGEYTQSDIDKLDNYYKGLERDHSIVTENHKDYARKIAKASLWCDKCLNDMINGVDGADDKYQTALKSFDSLSKSAKFSESTRSVADIGLNSISRITDLVEAHNWIPKHTPVEKDDIDTLLDLIPKTIKKSF